MYPEKSKLDELKERAGLGRVPTGVLAILLAAIVALVGFAAWSWYAPSKSGGVEADLYGQSSAEETETQDDEPVASSSQDTASATGRVTVHVVGAVKAPGMYELESGTRVGDAIEAAGGVTSEAEVRAVNFAAVISDGTQVIVPTVKEVESGAAQAMGTASTGGTAGVSEGPTSAGAGVAATGVVNINTADSTTLETLPGIGPATAGKIIADREKNGPFKSTSDIQRVSGIGPKKYEALTGLISVQ